MDDNTANESKFGLTKKEQAVLLDLIAAWNNFLDLSDSTQDDVDDFRRSIHECQRILAARLIARQFPEEWN